MHNAFWFSYKYVGYIISLYECLEQPLKHCSGGQDRC